MVNNHVEEINHEETNYDTYEEIYREETNYDAYEVLLYLHLTLIILVINGELHCRSSKKRRKKKKSVEKG